GYDSNETGFGWTNAAFLVIYNDLSFCARRQFIAACESGAGAWARGGTPVVPVCARRHTSFRESLMLRC
ncbi:MAG TPA: hypothetical protein PLP04_08730, partial [Bryobacteraceae bacterium]|nr:hypothetical protein [Bryobacteraceae bacterium]